MASSTTETATFRKYEDEYSKPSVEDEDTGAHVSPILRLRGGEENEDVLLHLKGILYRFYKEGNQWKERGVGTMKLLKHQETGKVRLVMRQNKTLKDLRQPSCGALIVGARACVWHAADFADGELKERTFCIRFASVKNVSYDLTDFIFKDTACQIAKNEEKPEEAKKAPVSGEEKKNSMSDMKFGYKERDL